MKYLPISKCVSKRLALLELSKKYFDQFDQFFKQQNIFSIIIRKVGSYIEKIFSIVFFFSVWVYFIAGL